jgi:tetratricopeptide (TPR) repeat protein
MAEKNINEVPREARLLFVKANEAAQRENLDYAIALFNQVLEKEPGFFDCRKALRAAQIQKAGSGRGFLKKMWGNASSQPQVAKAMMAMGKNPAEAMAIAEEILNGDPNSSAAHRLIVQGANALELPQTAVMSLENMVKNSPKDKNLAIEFAYAVGTTGGDTGPAERVLAELLDNSPNDGELNQALKDLSARKTLDQGGYNALEDGKGSFRDILKDKEQAVSLEQEKRVVKSEDVTERLIGEYETRLKSEPNNLKITRELAKLYGEKKQFDKALALFDRVKKSDMGSDPSLEGAIADTIVHRFDHQLEQLDSTTPDYAERSAKIQAEKLDFQVTECQERVDKYPTDLAIRFEMGQLYFQVGKISQAIQEFQKAQQNPHRRLSAMSYLAQCFAKRKMFDLAARTLQNAIKEKPVFDEEKKDLVYNLGCVLESMGKKDEAIEQFKLIYETDASYKDVTAKVEAFYAGQ